ncbi:MAG TPA: chemotaxis protein CheW [Steroidobacteraceae bacterium]
MSAPAQERMRQVCTFMVDGLLFGVDVAQVQEVLRYQEMTPVPLASSVVSGLINLRGEIVTALDMRQRLGMPPRAENLPPTNLILRDQQRVISLLVDEIGDVVEVSTDSFEPAPETLPPASRALIDGVYKFKPQLLLLLNTERAVRVEPFGAIKRNEHVSQ